ncbi:aminoglycoside phosphotransferase family protein [uncultured Mucilaginibacter sp.]|uniref:phosphotransferase enzyme family protein n=1 Tax=uncultured Mucilaginibacter sp. TaxID=797541 RepID=UPI0025FEEE4E|nr:aminoglycoside phosphotransferase family protein [uncultured Mucilaginibacter sp.]
MNSSAMLYDFTGIIAQFNIEEGDFEISGFGSGHINDTYLVKYPGSTHPGYLLQKINSFVFKNIDGLMNNMLCVVTHLKHKIGETCGNPDREVLTLIPTKGGKYYYKDLQNNYWRMTCFLADTKSYDLVTTKQQAYQGGVAFGRFQYLLSDLDPAFLIDTIPDFLNIEKRLFDFRKAIERDTAGRLKEVKEEVDFLESRAAAMNEIPKLGKANILPLRITHNDTKFNNILLDKDGNIQCVIDLDTVMPGYIAFDFGDAIRTIINTAAEDEADLNKIRLNIPLFAEFTKGYLSETRSFLTEAELKSLMMGVLLLPYMQAVRFLTDYLEGDVYYKTHFAGHNLQRTHAQIQLFKMLELNKKELENIVQTEWNNLKAGVALKVPVIKQDA